jgi:hypothetical protein
MTVTTGNSMHLEVHDQGSVSPVNKPSLKQWRPAAKLKKGEHLQTPDGSLAVADGGTTPMYTVSAFMNEDTWFELVGDDQATGEVSMVIGGQRVPQPVRYIVDAERALKAARFFSREGNLDEEESWERP